MVEGRVKGTPPPNPRFSSVQFVSPNQGFLLEQKNGGESALLTTVDGGRTWSVVGSAIAPAVLDFVSATKGFGLTGNEFLATVDGGKTWQRVFTFPSIQGQSSGIPATRGLSFIDPAYGWVADGGGLYRTRDGGTSWKPVSLPGSCGWTYSFSFVSPNTGYLVCGGQPGTGVQMKQLYRTADGGATWVPRSSSTPQSGGLGLAGYIANLDFPSAQTGYLSLARGGLIRTTDGGQTWSAALPQHVGGVVGTSWPTPTTGYLLLNGALLRTSDAGAHWQQVYPALIPAGKAAFVSPSRGFGVGTIWDSTAVLATTDGGKTWSRLGSLPAGLTVTSLVPLTAKQIWVAGYRITPDGSTFTDLLRSDDGGQSWRLVRTFTGQGLYLSFATPNLGFLGFAGNQRPYLYRTQDGGASWKKISTNQIIWKGQFVSAQEGWGLGQGWLPTLLRTTDGGRTWAEVHPPLPNLQVSRIQFLNARNGWLQGVSGSEQVLLRTTDGGSTWEGIQFPGSWAATVDFVTPRVGFAINGYGGVVYRTDDGGRDWQIIGG